MDEAFVEAIIVRQGMQVRYAPDAIVYNTGPTTVSDFVRQRRRNHAGHLYLKHKYGYKVSSIENRRVARIAFKELWGIVRLVWVIFSAGLHRRHEPLSWAGTTLPSSATATSSGTWPGRKSRMCRMCASTVKTARPRSPSRFRRARSWSGEVKSHA
jgi:hypothetical protein